MKMNSVVLVPIGIVVVLLFLAILFASRYKTVGADSAMIITGAGTRNGLKIVKAGGALVLPIIQQAQTLSLRMYTLEVKTPEVYTEQGVPVMVDGVAQIKIQGDNESISTAAEQFLGKQEHINMIATETLEGHLRAILGQMTVEDIYKNREKFAQEVQDTAARDFAKMGLVIVSFTIKNVNDKNGYLDALGRPQIASIRKEAEIAEANANRDTQIAKAQAREKGQKADFIAETNIAEANKEMEIKKADFKKEQDLRKAEADQAYKLQEARSLQQVKAEEMQINIVEREKQIELESKEIERREKQYTAEVRKKAEADRYKVEQEAEAEKVRKQREADALQYSIEAEAKANAEKVRLAGQATADAQKVEGFAEAEVIRQKGFAEAEAKDKIAEAMKKFGEAAIAEMMIKQFPSIAEAISAPLSKTEKIVVIDNGNGQGGRSGASKVTGYVTDILGTLPETVSALTNIDLVDLVEKLTKQPKVVEQAELPEE
jgi:flotillin